MNYTIVCNSIYDMHKCLLPFSNQNIIEMPLNLSYLCQYLTNFLFFLSQYLLSVCVSFHGYLIQWLLLTFLTFSRHFSFSLDFVTVFNTYFDISLSNSSLIILPYAKKCIFSHNPYFAQPFPGLHPLNSPYLHLLILSMCHRRSVLWLSMSVSGMCIVPWSWSGYSLSSQLTVCP